MFSKDTSDTWQISSADTINSSSVDDIVSTLASMEVDAFIAQNPSYTFPYGLTDPQGKLEFFAGANKEVEIEIGFSKNNRTYLKNPRSGWVVAVDDDKLKKVLITLEDILDK
jgi:hypothetical protein